MGRHPPELDRLIASCLEKKPEARWHSARDLSLALKGLLSSSESARHTVEVSPGGRGQSMRRLVYLAAGLLLIASVAFLIRNRTLSSGAIRSIAVLPLRNLSGDPLQDYFADGMTESLISNLAQIRALKVISRTSVMCYKNTAKPLPEIAGDLNVDAIVDGSVQRAGGRVKIMAQLIRGRDDVHLWAKEYEGELTDVLRLESEVARTIAGEIRVQVTPSEKSRLSSARMVDPKAYEAYLLGRHHLWKLQERDLRQAITHFERAIQIDPSFAEAYAGLAAALAERGVWGEGGFHAGESKAKSAAQKAMQLDPNLADAHATLAFLEYHFDWNWSGAEKGFQRALVLDPNNRQAHTHYAVMLMALGRFPESLSHIDAARELDPAASYVESSYGRILYRARRYTEALPHFQRASQLEPNDYSVYPRLADLYLQMGKYPEALAAVEKARTVSTGAPLHSLRLAQIYARMGKRLEALQTLEKAKSNPDWGRHVLDIALTYAALGDKDQAFVWLDKGVEQRELVFFVKTEPKCDSLRGDPRFDRIVERIGLR
jgi:TolB-like protein/Flp pilus assembly protein TadD